MEIRRWLPIAVLAVATAGWQGCAWRPSAGPFSGRSEPDPGFASEAPTRASDVSTPTNGLSHSFVPSQTASNEPNAVTSAYRKAKEAVSDALTIEPKVVPADDPTRLSGRHEKLSADVHRRAAHLMESRGNVEKAIEQYQRALQADAWDIATYVSFARLHDRQGNFDESIKLYQRALKVDPDSAVVWNDMGLCLARHGQVRSSLSALRRAIEIDPERKLYRNNLATVLVESGAPDDAFHQLIAVHDPGVAHYNVAYLLHQQGREGEARQHLDSALRHDPHLEAGHQLLAQLDGRPLTHASQSPPSRELAEPQPRLSSSDEGRQDPIRELPVIRPPAPGEPFSSPVGPVRLMQPPASSQPTIDTSWGDPPAAPGRTATRPLEDSPRSLPPVITISD